MENLIRYKEYLLARNQSMVYYNYIKLWLQYCNKKNIDYLYISQKNITDFFNCSSYSSNSKNNFIKSGRSFYSFLNIAKENNEWFKIKLLEVERKQPKYITFEELLQGIKYYSTYSKAGMSSTKCNAILKFLFFTGIRKGELLSLNREKIDLINCSVNIWGQKDKTERIVYFPNIIIKDLTDYFNSEKELNNAFSITLAEINYLSKKIGKYLNKNISTHIFRHSSATYMMRQNISPLVIQRILGHNSLQTTLIYANPDDKLAQEVYKKQIG